ncbi:MAG: YbbR-like domain-containing protein [Gemmatimonadetes bacterium]|nr:YbbR-like domain-containing protein [Gemmatimonadota bacterium]
MRLIPALTRNWALKLTALGLALLLWSVTKADAPTRFAFADVELAVSLRDPGWMLAAPPFPESVTVVLSGPARELLGIAVEKPRVIVPIEEVRDSAEIRQIRYGWVDLPGRYEKTRVEDVRPGSVRLLFERLSTRLVPVSLPVRGQPPTGLVLAAPVRLEPPAVRVTGPARLVDALDSMRLPPQDLGAITAPGRITVRIDTTGLGDLIVAPRAVSLIVPLARQ